MTDVRDVALHRTLDQELFALLRGASLECLVCGEFVLHARRSDLLPGVRLEPARSRAQTAGVAGYNSSCRPGDREPRAAPRKVRTPQGRTLGKSQAAKADGKWHRKETASGDRLSGDAGGKGEKVG